MGWLRTLLLGDIGNRLDIADNEDRIRRIRSSNRRIHAEKRTKDASQDAAIARLEHQVEELQVTIALLSQALVDSGAMSAEQLQQLDRELDRDPDPND